ncbi:MAG: DUF4019 domain-containing protein [bacterium]
MPGSVTTMHCTTNPAFPLSCNAAAQFLRVLLLCSLIYAQGCATNAVAEQDPLDAQNAVVAWLQLLDSKDYDATYRATASFFKQRVTAEQWQAQVSQVRSALGETLSRQAINASYSNKLSDTKVGDYIIFEFQTEFAGQSRAVETVTVALDGRIWRTVGYFVR